MREALIQYIQPKVSALFKMVIGPENSADALQQFIPCGKLDCLPE